MTSSPKASFFCRCFRCRTSSFFRRRGCRCMCSRRATGSSSRMPWHPISASESSCCRPGFEADYFGAPPVYACGTVAHIEQTVTLDDGRYNILVHGETRFRIIDEVSREPYRVARVVAQPQIERRRQRRLRAAHVADGVVAAVPPLSAGAGSGAGDRVGRSGSADERADHVAHARRRRETAPAREPTISSRAPRKSATSCRDGSRTCSSSRRSGRAAIRAGISERVRRNRIRRFRGT